MEILDGKYVSNGDKNVFVKIIGEGETTVVIEPDWGCLSLEWEAVQREIAAITRVMSYDRPGYAESPKASNPRLSGQIADELYNTLKNADIAPPYLLLAHGGGGLYAQHFCKMFANEVTGMILVDSATALDFKMDNLDMSFYNANMSFETRMNSLKKYLEMERSEFEQTVNPILISLKEHYPECIREAMISYLTDQGLYETILNEMQSRDESIKYLEQLQIFSNMPVKVLCRDYKLMIELLKELGAPEDEARAVEERQLQNSKELLNLSLESDMEIISGSSHNIHLDRPDAIISAILNIINVS